MKTTRKCKECKEEYKLYTTLTKCPKCTRPSRIEGPKSKPERWKVDEEYDRAKKLLNSILIKKHGRVICELHKDCSFEFLGLQTHHIIYRSEKPKHEHLHSIKNLIKVCLQGHAWFHEKKSNRNQIVRDRKLNELFGDDVLDK